MVSAWKEMGATLWVTVLPMAPTKKARAVGMEAKPKVSASKPWGKPLSTTPMTAMMSVKI